jgi:hypothetical protein
MSYTSEYPRQFEYVFSFLNLEVNGDPTAEDIALYNWFDNMIEICYGEAENYCGQPLRNGVVDFRFDIQKTKKGFEENHCWKYIPYYAGTSLQSLQHRENEFASFQNVNANDYSWSSESYGHYIVIRNLTKGQVKATLSTGFTDANMPRSILQGIAEMVSLIYKQSPQGGNWFGLSSVSTGGAGQNVSSSLKTEIDWKKYFNAYVIPTV